MKLRVFVPPVDAIDASTRVPWTLFDSRDRVLREETTPLADIPRADDVELALPASRVLFARLKLPRVGAATIRELLPYAVEDRLVADPSNIHAVAGRRGTGGDTTVAVVDRVWLQGIIDAFRRAGLKPARAWGESALLLAPRGEWHVVCGRDRGLLVDDRDVSVAFDRSGPALPLALRIALDEAAARGERPDRIVVHPEDAEALPDLDAWRAESGVGFLPGVAWEEARREAPALHAIDLLQGEFSAHAPAVAWSRIPRAAVAIAGTLVVLQVAFTAVDAWRLERERGDLEARREAIFRSAFPEARAVVDPDLQMSRNLADLRRSRGLAGGDDFLAQLTRAAREAPQPVRAIDYANGRLGVTR